MGILLGIFLILFSCVYQVKLKDKTIITQKFISNGGNFFVVNNDSIRVSSLTYSNYKVGYKFDHLYYDDPSSNYMIIGVSILLISIIFKFYKS